MAVGEYIQLRSIYIISELSVRGLTFRVYIDLSPCPRFSSQTSVSELVTHVAISSDEDVRGCTMRMLKAASSRGRYCERATVEFCIIMSTTSTMSRSRSQLSDADTEKLINIVEKRPLFCDVRDKRYKGAIIAKNAWQTIGTEVVIADVTSRPTCFDVER